MKEFCPHNYQQYCIDRIIRDPALGLFLDMGLGKTGYYTDCDQAAEV